MTIATIRGVSAFIFGRSRCLLGAVPTLVGPPALKINRHALHAHAHTCRWFTDSDLDHFLATRTPDDIERAKTRLGLTKDSHYESLAALDRDDLIAVLGDLAELGKIDLRRLVKIVEQLPSSPSAKCSEIPPEFKLPENIASLSRSLKLEENEVPHCFLPPSFHQQIFPLAWRALDVYGDPTYTIGLESARLRLLEPVRNFIVCFSSCTIDERHNSI
jgi:hypothetical protein